MSDFLKKFGLKPKKLKFEYEGEEQTVYYKPISYNLAIAIANQYNDTIRQLIIIRHCLCDEDGTMVFDEQKELAEIGDELPFEVIGLVSAAIAKTSGPKERDDQITKKPVS